MHVLIFISERSRWFVRTLQLLTEHGKEDGEVDGAGGLLHHCFQLLILHVELSHGGQHVPQVVLADDAIPVLVNDCESLRIGEGEEEEEEEEEGIRGRRRRRRRRRNKKKKKKKKE